MNYPHGSNPQERGGVRNVYVWGFLVGAVLTAVGFGPLIALSILNETGFEVPSQIRAGFAVAGVAGFGIAGFSILLMRFDPPPNPY